VLERAVHEMARVVPPLQHGVLAAAEQNDALLVSFENVYGYGPTGGAAMTEDLPLLASTVRGRTRAAMTAELLAAAAANRVRIAVGRAADFFGPGVIESTLGQQVFGKAVGSKQRRMSSPDPLMTRAESGNSNVPSALMETSPA